MLPSFKDIKPIDRRDELATYELAARAEIAREKVECSKYPFNVSEGVLLNRVYTYRIYPTYPQRLRSE